jgi:hypothetical protein
MNVGNVVTLKQEMLGCKPGTRGVVFNTYQDFDDPNKLGCQIIFENGNYDGFSVTEQKLFLDEEYVKYIPFYIREYKFENVIKVSKDFESGLWDDIFR